MERTKKTVGLTENSDYVCFEDLQLTQNISIVNPINLDYCGREQCQPGFRFGPYVRECYVIHLVLKGCGELETKKGNYHLSAGQAFLIRPHQEITYEADVEDPWEYMWVGFHGCRAEEFVSNMGFANGNFVIRSCPMEALKQTVWEMLAARQLTYADELIRMSALFRFFALLMRDYSEHRYSRPGGHADSVYVRNAINIITCSYKQKIRISELAATIGISRGHLTNVFRQELNISPREFIINLRMEKAAQMLRETEDPVNVISAEVGYSDSLSFSKAFKQKYGISPTMYRDMKIELAKKDRKGEYTSEYPL